jgi:hypothetical protein
MTYFGFEDLPEKLAGNGIHTLENVLTLDANFSFFFETLEMWFEPIVSGLGIFTPRTALKVYRILRITRMLFEQVMIHCFVHVGTTQSH